MRKKNKKSGKGGIDSAKTFAELAKLLKIHKEIEWEWDKGGTIQANYHEDGERYRIKVSSIKERGGLSVNFHGPNFIGCSNSPLWWDFKYGISVTLGKKEVVEFSGQSNSTGSIKMLDEIGAVMAKHQKLPYFLPRREFLDFWEWLLTCVPNEAVKK
ncbi:MAG: hypothetical protein YFSK_5160 [Candidatus Yanofskyibacterium parasiticum]|jgi:hypothetical protein|nr:MAG: hypothetical protein YFSK_5160 [Candidatus Yanofskybacteria bacterium]